MVRSSGRLVGRAQPDYKSDPLQSVLKLQTGRIVKTPQLEARYKRYIEKLKKTGAKVVPYTTWKNRINVLQRRVKAKPRDPSKIATSSIDRKLIPWLPVVINGIQLKLMTTLGIRVPGHIGTTYNAGWASINKNYFGAWLKMNANGRNPYILNKLYVGNTNFTTKKPQIVSNSTLNTRILAALRSNPTSGKRTMVKSNYTGPSVAELSEVINPVIKGSGDEYELMSSLGFKLIGDRITAETVNWINSSPLNKIIKPYDKKVGKLIIETFYSGQGTFTEQDLQKLVKELHNQLFMGNGLPGFIFDNACAFTGERPLPLYCILKGIPCIYSPNFMNIYYAHLDAYNTLINGKTFTNPVLNAILNGPGDIIERLAIFDCFHDFGKGGLRVITSPDVTFESVHFLMYKMYGNKHSDLINWIDGKIDPNCIIKNQKSVTDGESAIVKEILEKLPQNQRNLSDIKNLYIDRFNMALMYDAGDMPKVLENRKGGAIHRVINSASARPGPIFKQLINRMFPNARP